jgi:hypothetical protein
MYHKRNKDTKIENIKNTEQNLDIQKHLDSTWGQDTKEQTSEILRC